MLLYCQRCGEINTLMHFWWEYMHMDTTPLGDTCILLCIYYNYSTYYIYIIITTRGPAHKIMHTILIALLFFSFPLLQYLSCDQNNFLPTCQSPVPSLHCQSPCSYHWPPVPPHCRQWSLRASTGEGPRGSQCTS